jgi:hypothetical protein
VQVGESQKYKGVFLSNSPELFSGGSDGRLQGLKECFCGHVNTSRIYSGIERLLAFFRAAGRVPAVLPPFRFLGGELRIYYTAQCGNCKSVIEKILTFSTVCMVGGNSIAAAREVQKAFLRQRCIIPVTPL